MYRLVDLADHFATASDAAEGLVLGAMAEQTLADRGTLLTGQPARTQLAQLLGLVRESLTSTAAALLDGSRPSAAASAAEAIRAATRLVLDRSAPAAIATRRRKYWPIIPECLSIHFSSVAELARAVRESAARPPDGPVTVVGVRSSGSVLAPLFAAVGDAPRHWVSVRPSDVPADTVCPIVVRELREAGVGPGLRVLVVDDPPTTGRTAAVVARSVAAAGAEPTGFLSVGQRDGALRRYTAIVTAGVPFPVCPERRRPYLSAWYGPYAVRDRGDFLVAYGDPAPARHAASALARVSPMLRPVAEGSRIRMRWAGTPDTAEVGSRERCRRAVALGRLAGRMAVEHEVDWISSPVWAKLLERRLAYALPTDAVPSVGPSTGRFAALPNGREWWNFRFQKGPDGAALLVPGLVGHWSQIADAGELLGAIALEFLMAEEEVRLLCNGFAEAAGFSISGEQLNVGMLPAAADLFCDLVRAEPRKVGAGWRNDRLRRLRYARRHLHSLGAAVPPTIEPRQNDDDRPAPLPLYP